MYFKQVLIIICQKKCPARKHNKDSFFTLWQWNFQ